MYDMEDLFAVMGVAVLGILVVAIFFIGSSSEGEEELRKDYVVSCTDMYEKNYPNLPSTIASDMCEEAFGAGFREVVPLMTPMGER